ncbi:unnamed protein product [Nippostrongylus brasiliensis]|uniref:Acetylcholine receptor subunit alpha-type deg-3 (inferred by orthology to a C. elegans protein) n=1 Tax=Nippostrongylus brasiliensis TaxID=27835 RepID=A0A0N4YPV3_NIPBR|nr:unnamed protein product [Nippostrongylus brasiliensis]
MSPEYKDCWNIMHYELILSSVVQTFLSIRFFPYDRQNCTLTISSWTNSMSALDYYADAEVNLASFIPNEEWDVKSFKIFRHEVIFLFFLYFLVYFSYKYACCAEPWAILQASLVIQRKPLYYIVNLIIPTSIITIVSITGFFTPASTDDDRTEKINLGITTLLAMSILMLMVSDQMPTTSEFVPLIAWFYLSIIIIISIGTFLTSVVLSVQSRRQYGRNPPIYIRYYFFVVIPSFIYLSVPPALEKLWAELDDDPLNSWRRRHQTSLHKTDSLYKERPPKSPPLLERNKHTAPSNISRFLEGGRRDAEKTPVLVGVGVLGHSAIHRSRFLLLLFISAVVLITMGLVVVGKMAQFSYDHPDESFF